MQSNWFAQNLYFGDFPFDIVVVVSVDSFLFLVYLICLIDCVAFRDIYFVRIFLYVNWLIRFTDVMSKWNNLIIEYLTVHVMIRFRTKLFYVEVLNDPFALGVLIK